jgi:hypothetical protein
MISPDTEIIFQVSRIFAYLLQVGWARLSPCSMLGALWAEEERESIGAL